MIKNKYSTAFIDLLFILALLFACMFAVAFMKMKSSDGQQGKIKTEDSIIFTLEWNHDSKYDFDIGILGPDGRYVYYDAPNVSWGILEHDDLGVVSDTYEINGQKKLLKINKEIIHLKNLYPGRYTVNVLLYSNKTGSTLKQQVQVEADMFKPAFKTLFKENITERMRVKQQITVMSFDYAPDIGATNLDNITQNHFMKKER